jgi:hypothetical protein
MNAVADKLARRILAQQGLAMIWKLHADAATLYWIGNTVAAESFIEIADLAEKEWLRQGGEMPEGSGSGAATP